MKLKNDITTNYFHDIYVEEFGRLHEREETSRRLYSKIIRLLFEFVKKELYAGETFTTPFGYFKIIKMTFSPRSEKKIVSHAASKLEGRIVYRNMKKNYFHKLLFAVTPNMEDRYYFRPLQQFVRKIYTYYD